jgi:hypothetical protein
MCREEAPVPALLETCAPPDRVVEWVEESPSLGADLEEADSGARLNPP